MLKKKNKITPLKKKNSCAKKSVQKGKSKKLKLFTKQIPRCQWLWAKHHFLSINMGWLMKVGAQIPTPQTAWVIRLVT